MSARSKARKRALDVLYGADVRGTSINDALAEAAARALTEPERSESWNYAREIVNGVVEHGDEIDELIETYAQGWTLARMPVVDRAIIRIGIWELLFNDEIPAGVAISEAVGQAREFSTEDSGKFVNGLLARISTPTTAV
ncbi:transcription antitermination factor NusB [Marisediminicola sp. LYQ85]|uniref:transcription antitermination factor NusB n=1 Tax=Marisediminicola sp. LYQ85 TaxID=3391062 RepID=UPI00398338B6